MNADEFAAAHGEHDGERERHSLTQETATMLAAARKSCGWSLRQAAARVGVRHGFVAMLERGERAPSRVTADALIDAYQLDAAAAALLRSEAVTGAGRDYRARRP
jgi:transcriptional regulator with XRE-family HTH domain